MSLLRYTGHPLVDVAVATVCAYCKKSEPESVTLEDLDECADFIEEEYFSGKLGAYLTCVFPNSAYTQPAIGKGKLDAWKQDVVRAHCAPPDKAAQAYRCAFSGEPATRFAARQHIPLLTGESIRNFLPDGLTSLPIAGPYLAASQMLPLGCRRAEGRLLAVHSDDPDLMLDFAERYLSDNLRLLRLYATSGGYPAEDDGTLARERAAADAKGDKSGGTADKTTTKVKRGKYPDVKSPLSLVLDDLADIERLHRRRRDATVTAYWLTNSGQGPSIDIYTFPAGLVRFVVHAGADPHGATWRGLVARAWRPLKEPVPDTREPAGEPKPKRKARKALKPGPPGGAGRSRNDVHVDLAACFSGAAIDRERARAFLRRHLLRAPEPRAPSGEEARLWRDGRGNWGLAELFLKEVLGMTKDRIETIRTVADRFADHIARVNDQRLFREVVFAAKPFELRGAIAKAQRREAQAGHGLLITLDQMLTVLLDDEGTGRIEWSLARDLLSIRLVERLHELGWIAKNKEAVEEPANVAAITGKESE